MSLSSRASAAELAHSGHPNYIAGKQLAHVATAVPNLLCAVSAWVAEKSKLDRQSSSVLALLKG